MSVILPLELQMFVCYPFYIIISTNDLQESVVKKRHIPLKKAKICFWSGTFISQRSRQNIYSAQNASEWASLLLKIALEHLACSHTGVYIGTWNEANVCIFSIIKQVLVMIQSGSTLLSFKVQATLCYDISVYSYVQ